MTSINMQILALNAGSSSLKFALFYGGGGHALRIRGKIDGIGKDPRLSVFRADGAALVTAAEIGTAADMHENLLEPLLDRLRKSALLGELAAAGHRFVHGGTEFTSAVRLDDAVLARLATLSHLAPLHQPRSIAIVRALSGLLPGIRQIGCFDTAFHASRPAVSRRYALPRELEDEGIIRYGFHGISYAYLSRVLPALDPALADARVIAAHLGNGASLCAMRGGRSVETSMGFSPLEGIPMSTRCGSIDASIPLYLLRQKGMRAEDVEQMLYSRSGLLGVSGISGDIRDLLSSNDGRAREAVDLFVYRIGCEIGALTAALGGVDAIVFTGGIGEHQPVVRARVCAHAQWLGTALDEAANTLGKSRISKEQSPVSVWVIPTDEESVLAQETRNLAINGSPPIRAT